MPNRLSPVPVAGEGDGVTTGLATGVAFCEKSPFVTIGGLFLDANEILPPSFNIFWSEKDIAAGTPSPPT